MNASVPLAIGDIETAICARFALSRDQMRGRDCSRRIARPRQIAMTLARELTGQSLPRIGRHFCRDHTTVLHAMRRIGRLCAADPAFAAEVAGCRELLARLVPGRAGAARPLAEGVAAP